MHITQDKLDQARRLHTEHPKMTWREIGDAVGEYGESIRSALRMDTHATKRAKHSRHKRGQRQLMTQYDPNTVVSFYFGKGHYNKELTGRRFGISAWCVCKVLAKAGHIEEVYPSAVTELTGLPISEVSHKSHRRRNGGRQPISEDKVKLAYSLWQSHEDWTWEQIGEASGIKPSTVRHCLKRQYAVTLHSPRLSTQPRQVAMDIKESVDMPPFTKDTNMLSQLCEELKRYQSAMIENAALKAKLKEAVDLNYKLQERIVNIQHLLSQPD